MRVVVVPGTPALLPAYASIDDPITELRGAVGAAVAWLREDGRARALASSPGARTIAEHLLGDGHGDGSGLLVVANGSAKRTEKAPGHFDARAAAFDESLGRGLREGDSAALAGIDESLAQQLWADVDALRSLGSQVDLAGADIQVDYDAAPYGVQYWVVRWLCAP
jgi:hypothetical protein